MVGYTSREIKTGDIIVIPDPAVAQVGDVIADGRKSIRTARDDDNVARLYFTLVYPTIVPLQDGPFRIVVTSLSDAERLPLTIVPPGSGSRYPI